MNTAQAAEAHEIRARPPLQRATALLQSASLPTADLTEAHLEHFFFREAANTIDGLVGVELYGSDALLRSLVVAPGARSRGLGAALVQHAERHARHCGVSTLYLLTTTAQRFFERLGYRCVERHEAPASIQSTSQFASLCPASSAFMLKQL
jgi:amino-acid N-acetyltransferase